MDKEGAIKQIREGLDSLLHSTDIIQMPVEIHIEYGGYTLIANERGYKTPQDDLVEVMRYIIDMIDGGDNATL